MNPRASAWRQGVLAEWLCLAWLAVKGYAILARRFRCPVGEIDIVARRGDTLVAVEVKARRDFDAAVSALTLRQRERILRAAEYFRLGLGARAPAGTRFDLMLVAPWRPPRHIENAWRAGE
ncbi:MAG: YraN family protein [Alphaproteobacteria bacterium]|nr:YraN family protein [Alphaproteobacteria bacterium]